MRRQLHGRVRCLSALSVCLLASCVTFPPPNRGTEELPLPSSFALYGPTVPSPDRWWQVFGSDELNRLVEEALSGNFTLQQAVARIRQAGAIAKQTGALRWPELNFNADASVTRTHTDTGESTPIWDTATQKLNALNTLLGGGATPTSAGGGTTTALSSAQSALRYAQSGIQAAETLAADPPSSEMTTTTESYALGLSASYELDLWGRLQASHQSAQLDFEASREDLFAAMQTIVGQVVLTWLDILQYRQILEVAREQLEANETTLELVELRYRKGMATALDVFQQRQAVAQVEATIPPLEAQLETLQHELAVLLGKPPRSDLALAADAFPEIGAVPEQGIPADLLALRPDVRASGFRLQSADWQVSAARADRLPAIRLTASAAYNAGEWDLLFDNWMAKLASSITGPIFDAGRREAEVDRTRAVVDERLAAYRYAVVSAVREVEDALVLEAKQQEYIDALEEQLAAARATHTEALGRYRKGLNDFLPVLSALTNAQALERALVQAEHDLLAFRTQLHLALGGSWMQQELVAREG